MRNYGPSALLNGKVTFCWYCEIALLALLYRVIHEKIGISLRMKRISNSTYMSGVVVQNYLFRIRHRLGGYVHIGCEAHFLCVGRQDESHQGQR